MVEVLALMNVGINSSHRRKVLNLFICSEILSYGDSTSDAIFFFKSSGAGFTNRV